jgi:hypothetical protein
MQTSVIQLPLYNNGIIFSLSNNSQYIYPLSNNTSYLTTKTIYRVLFCKGCIFKFLILKKSSEWWKWHRTRVIDQTFKIKLTKRKNKCTFYNIHSTLFLKIGENCFLIYVKITLYPVIIYFFLSPIMSVRPLLVWSGNLRLKRYVFELTLHLGSLYFVPSLRGLNHIKST